MAESRRVISANSKTWSGIVQLQWQKSPVDDWCVLDKVDLSSFGEADALHGVFVIWRGGHVRQVVLYVGRGLLRRELADCRRDPLFRGEPGLRVTWATVGLGEVDGVAAYLYEQLRPVWGEMVPALVRRMPVNLPMTA